MPPRRTTRTVDPGEVEIGFAGKDVALLRGVLEDCPPDLVARAAGAGWVGRWNYATTLTMRAGDWRTIAQRLAVSGREGIRPEALERGDVAAAFAGLPALTAAEQIAARLPESEEDH